MRGMEDGSRRDAIADDRDWGRYKGEPPHGWQVRLRRFRLRGQFRPLGIRSGIHSESASEEDAQSVNGRETTVAKASPEGFC